MATITAADVNKLRKQTGAGMMDCKKALVEAEGDFEKAVDFLRKKGQKVAANRADRDATEGAVIALTNADNTKGIDRMHVFTNLWSLNGRSCNLVINLQSGVITLTRELVRNGSYQGCSMSHS